MKPFDFPLFADENIDPAVIDALLKQKLNIVSTVTEGLAGHADVEILRRARADGRVVLTHDGDFGTLAIRAVEPYVGIIYLRPGHISARFVLEIINAIQCANLDVSVPFIVIAERKSGAIRLRVRQA